MLSRKLFVVLFITFMLALLLDAHVHLRSHVKSNSFHELKHHRADGAHHHNHGRAGDKLPSEETGDNSSDDSNSAEEGNTPALEEPEESAEPTSEENTDPKVEAPAETEAPAEVDASAETEAPAAQESGEAEVEAPAETEAPTGTEAPAETAEPTSEENTDPKVEAPAETEAPAEVDASAETEAPAAQESGEAEVEAPAETEAPTGTEAPAETAEPTSEEDAGSEIIDEADVDAGSQVPILVIGPVPTEAARMRAGFMSTIKGLDQATVAIVGIAGVALSIVAVFGAVLIFRRLSTQEATRSVLSDLSDDEETTVQNDEKSPNSNDLTSQQQEVDAELGEGGNFTNSPTSMNV